MNLFFARYVPFVSTTFYSISVIVYLYSFSSDDLLNVEHKIKAAKRKRKYEWLKTQIKLRWIRCVIMINKMCDFPKIDSHDLIQICCIRFRVWFWSLTLSQRWKNGMCSHRLLLRSNNRRCNRFLIRSSNRFLHRSFRWWSSFRHGLRHLLLFLFGHDVRYNN